MLCFDLYCFFFVFVFFGLIIGWYEYAIWIWSNNFGSYAILWFIVIQFFTLYYEVQFLYSVRGYHTGCVKCCDVCIKTGPDQELAGLVYQVDEVGGRYSSVNTNDHD